MRRIWMPLLAARAGTGCAGPGLQLAGRAAFRSRHTCVCRCVVVSTAGGLTKRPRRHRGGLWGNHRRCAAPPTITTQCSFILAAWAVHGGQHWQHDPIGGLVGWGHGEGHGCGVVRGHACGSACHGCAQGMTVTHTRSPTDAPPTHNCGLHRLGSCGARWLGGWCRGQHA